MTTAEALNQIDELKKEIKQVEFKLDVLRSILSPPKKKKPKQKVDFSEQIKKALLKHTKKNNS